MSATMEEVLITLGLFLLVFLLVIISTLWCMKRYKSRPDALGPAAQLPGGPTSCTSCQLIDMGEMACYGGVCSKCGQVPPSRKLQVVKIEMHQTNGQSMEMIPEEKA